MADNSEPSLETTARIPVRLVAALLVLSGIVVGLGSNPASPDDRGVEWTLLTIGIGAITLLVDFWQVWLSRCLAVVGSGLSVYLTGSWLRLPGASVLLVIPVALAAGLVGPVGAAATAVGVTMLSALPGVGPFMGDLSAVTLILAWLTVLAALYVHLRSRQLADWAWEHYERARTALDQARDRQLELKQAMDDAADANRQLVLLNQKLAAAQLVAEQAERTKATFVATVSHELRTPLNLILGFSEMIARGPKTYGHALPPALVADLGVVLRNAQHLSGLIDDVLDLSQIEAGRVALTKDRIALQEVIETAVAAVRRLYASKGLYLRTEVQPDLPAVYCDRTRIREVLLNLLNNAASFTEQGGVLVRAWQEGTDVVVSVADTGPGISAADSQRIFQPFQQLDGSIRRRQGGSGLGLSICKHFVELHGGHIWLESELGKGSTFLFRLPILPSLPQADAPTRWLKPGWEYEQRTRRSKAPVPDARPRLVILESGTSLRHLLTRHLDGVELIAATDVEEALGKVGSESAEALLVNGPSLVEELAAIREARAMPHGRPAIVCSLPGIDEAANSLGVDDYLVKPFPPERLLATLQRMQINSGTVLVVDDEPEALRLYWRILSSGGHDYRVLTAANGEEALELLAEKPDVVLLDLVMPEMDGFRFLTARNQDPALRRIPVVVVSARDPTGQPIVSDALAVMQGGGLSAHQLVACLEAILGVLVPERQLADRRRPRNQPG
ncbi:MAG: ATP-binding protein [Anaerolineae bacterium]